MQRMGFGLTYFGVVAILLMCVIIPLPANAACPPGWVPFSNTCYIFFRERFVFEAIRRRCKGLGARMLEINNHWENDFVTRYVNNRFGKGHEVWLGIQQLRGGWQLISDETPVSFTRWSENQPDNTIHMEFGVEHCAVIWSDGTWNDVWCYGPPRHGACSKPS